MVKIKKRWLSLIMAGLIISFGAAMAFGYPEKSQQPQQAKEFTLKDLQSKKVNLSDFHGKVVLLNFFATWCSPCRIEIPELVKIHQKNKNKNFVLLGISLDMDAVPFMIKSFAKEMKIPYPILIGTPEVAEQYQVSGVPVTLVINKEGKIQKRFLGLVHPDQIEKAINDLLETKS
jgi:peroxiredoxin